jgi:hypothetical protein
MIYRVDIELTETMLGSAPLSKDVYADYIASKAEAVPEVAAVNGYHREEELAAIAEEKKGVTGFLRLEDGRPFLQNHAIKGFMSNAATAHKQHRPDSATAKLTMYKSKINLLVDVSPRQIPLQLSGPVEILSRPLRAETMQGPRVALASSETVPAGTRLSFEVGVFADKTITSEMIEEWFEFGVVHGLGQWRGSGMYGQFTAEVRVVSKPEFTPRHKWASFGIV